MFSSFITIFITALQLYNDYLIDKKEIYSSQEYILSSYRKPLEASLWLLNVELIQSQVKGIISIPNITYASIRTVDDGNWEQGKLLDNYAVEQTLVLKYKYKGVKELVLGELVIQSDLSVVYKKLIDKAAIILLFNGLKTFLVAGFIILMVRRLVTKPLNKMIEYFKKYQFGRENPPIYIDRHKKYNDEIDFMSKTVNSMCEELSGSYATAIESQKQLQQVLLEKQELLEQETHFKENLEVMVQERTVELEQTLQALKDAQKNIIEQEKMASLGSLVAGIAHEINTPIGISITASSYLHKEVDRLSQGVEKGEISRVFIEQLIKNMKESSQLLERNLLSSANLISSFKQVAVDQTSEACYEFNLAEHLDQVVSYLGHEIKQSQAKIEIKCAPELIINSYPGSFSQVYTNLILNSLIHGFKDWNEEKVINIDIMKKEGTLEIDYRDSGKGIEDSIKHSVFEPFVTTTLGQGGSGLGTHIIYNIVVQLLKGTIVCYTEQTTGAHFHISIPISCNQSAVVK